MWTRTLLFLAVHALPAVAHADPCEGALPRRAGATFSGIVRHVGDGESLCAGQTSDPGAWIEVRLADFYAPELNAQGAARRCVVRRAPCS